MLNTQTKRLSRRNSLVQLGSNTDPSLGFDGSRIKSLTMSTNQGEGLCSAETIQTQNRWKNKAHSQPHFPNQRVLSNRLRVAHSQEFLNDLKNRRKSRPKRRNSRRKLFTPLDRFRRIALLVRLLIRCLVDYRRVTLVSHVSQMSFAMLSNDLVAKRTYRHGLTFDPNDYRAAKKTLLTDKLRNILTLVPYQRTKEQVEYFEHKEKESFIRKKGRAKALKCLRAEVEEFAEFPLSMQQALVKVAWLDEFEPKRIIIRQGHKAETFYFIISGTALVTKNRINANGEGYVETVSILKRGKSFGELAIMRHEQRTNNVVSQTHTSLLTVGRTDFVEIFMHRMDGAEPEFISFLRKLPEFQGYPLDKIPRNKPNLCAFTYFRVGVVICTDSNKSDVIVIVRSGVCRVVKCLDTTKPNIPGLHELPFIPNYETSEFASLSSLPSSAVGSRKSTLHSSLGASQVSMLTSTKHPTLLKRYNTKMSKDFALRSESFMSEIPNYPERKYITFANSSQEHRRKIWKMHKKWQEEHPISRETFALLMTGREIDDKNDDARVEDEEIEDCFDIRKELDSYCYKHETGLEKCGSASRRSSTQSDFRACILKRNRSSLADAWTKPYSKKMSSTITSLPTLDENISSRSTKSIRSSSGASSHKSYIHVQTLREKDVFGLLPIVFDKSEGATSVSLISDGAECILINKDFFIKHFDDELRERLVRMIRPYPSESALQANMQNQTNWDAYKFITVHSHMSRLSKPSLIRSRSSCTCMPNSNLDGLKYSAKSTSCSVLAKDAAMSTV